MISQENPEAVVTLNWVTALRKQLRGRALGVSHAIPVGGVGAAARGARRDRADGHARRPSDERTHRKSG